MAVLNDKGRRRRRRAGAEANTHGLPTGEPLRRELVRAFKRQRAAVLDFLKTGRKADDGPLPYAMPGFDDFGLGALPMSRRMTPILRLTWETAAAKFAPRVGLDPDEWSVVNPHTAAMIETAALKFCEATNETTSLTLNQALAKLREQLHVGVVETGETLEQLTKRVKLIFDAAETWRARRIAQSETSRAVHAAQEQAAIDSGVVRGWEWLASSDACPACLAVAEKARFVKLGQPFAITSADPTYGTVKFPPLHPHCNCTCLEVLDTDPAPAWSPTASAADLKPTAEPEPKPRPEHWNPPLPIRDPKPPTPPEPIPDYLPTDEEIAHAPPKPKKPKAPPKPRKPKPDPFPADLTGLEVVQKLGGSTGAVLVRDPATGRRYVMKRGGNPGHLREEATADDLYRALGIKVPDSRLYEVDGKPIKLAEYHVGVPLGELKRKFPAVYDLAVKRIQEGFVADALLGNWDVIGMNADNILVTGDGTPLRIDNGGSLRYRAQGALKPPSQWTGAVGELNSLRDPKRNPTAAAVFGGLTDDEIKGQIKRVRRARKRLLEAAPAEIRPILAERLASLAEFGKPVKPVRVGNWKPTPAEQFRRFDTTADMAKWGGKHYGKWRKALTPREREGINFYTGGSYRKTNQYLRDVDLGRPAGSPPPGIAWRDDMDKALNATVTPHGIVAYRGINLDYVFGGAHAPEGVSSISMLKPGMDLRDPAFSSTSLDTTRSFPGTKFEVRIPAGTPGAWVMPISKVKSEMEFLLPREVDTFRIVEVRPDIIVVEALMSSKLDKPKRAKGKK